MFPGPFSTLTRKPIPELTSAGSASRTAPIASTSVTQFAVLDALLGGVYSSGIAVPDVRLLGDTGIGCCEGLGGEVVVLDGQLFECTTDGPPRLMDDSEVLPFVDVCTLADAATAEVEGLDLDGIGDAVDARLASRNLFHVVRLDGAVSRVKTRVTRRQEAPFRPLAEVAAEQIETVTVDRAGSLVGFWMPRIYQGITVAGLHLHFLSDDRLVGGHVLEVQLDSARLRVAAFARFTLQLPQDAQFLGTELTHDDDHRIVAVEGGPLTSSTR